MLNGHKLRYAAAFLVLGLPVATTQAAEFFDADILPQVTSIYFAEDEIGFQIGHEGYDGFEYPAFVVARSTDIYESVHPSAIAGRPAKSLSINPYRFPDGAKETSNGTRYAPETTGPDYLPSVAGLSVDGRVYPLSLDDDVGITEVEIAHDKIWVGTYYSGDHGAWGAHGVIVVSQQSGEEVGRVDTGLYPVSGVRLDPHSGDIWAFTRDQVLVIDRKLEVKKKYIFYYDFDPQTERPVARISQSERKSHPLAVFALHLPASYHAAFYKAVSSIPDNVARTFSLYELYMCCDFSTHTDDSTKPKEFEILIPFLLPAFEKDLPRWEYNGQSRSQYASRMWRQIACRHKSNATARQLCDTEDWGELLKHSD